MGYAIHITASAADLDVLEAWAEELNARLRYSESVVFEMADDGHVVAIVKPFGDLDRLVEAIDGLADSVDVVAEDDFGTHVAGRTPALGAPEPVESVEPRRPDVPAELVDVQIDARDWGVEVAYSVRSGIGVVVRIRCAADPDWQRVADKHEASGSLKLVWVTPPRGPYEVAVAPLGARSVDRAFEVEEPGESWLPVNVSPRSRDERLALAVGDELYVATEGGYLEVPLHTDLSDAMVMRVVEEAPGHVEGFPAVDPIVAGRAVVEEHARPLLDACGSVEAAFAYLVQTLRRRRQVEALSRFVGAHTVSGPGVEVPALEGRAVYLAKLGAMSFLYAYGPEEALEALASLAPRRDSLLATARRATETLGDGSV